MLGIEAYGCAGSRGRRPYEAYGISNNALEATASGAFGLIFDLLCGGKLQKLGVLQQMLEQANGF